MINDGVRLFRDGFLTEDDDGFVLNDWVVLMQERQVVTSPLAPLQRRGGSTTATPVSKVINGIFIVACGRKNRLIKPIRFLKPYRF